MLARVARLTLASSATRCCDHLRDFLASRTLIPSRSINWRSSFVITPLVAKPPLRAAHPSPHLARLYVVYCLKQVCHELAGRSIEFFPPKIKNKILPACNWPAFPHGDCATSPVSGDLSRIPPSPPLEAIAWDLRGHEAEGRKRLSTTPSTLYVSRQKLVFPNLGIVSLQPFDDVFR